MTGCALSLLSLITIGVIVSSLIEEAYVLTVIAGGCLAMLLFFMWLNYDIRGSYE